MNYKELIGKDAITQRVAELGQEISAHYKNVGGELIVVGLLRGAFIFMADLVRAIEYDHEVDFMIVSSYGDSTISSGDVKVVMDLNREIGGKHLLLVEDIVDTGHTFHNVINLLKLRNPASISVATLLNKPSRRQRQVPIDYCGFEIPDKFVFGMGLDCEQKLRNLPFIALKAD
ncbi:MAG: hypoxanthine phosphoribosyltransferase [Desulfuromonas sp.]|nr:hypoxanthine phosphoribosyltransferase [Desulfuromonas sp.]